MLENVCFSTKRRLEEDTYQSRASKRLQKAWELSGAEKEDLCRWRTSAHERFEAQNPWHRLTPGKKGKKEEASNKANLCLKKLLDTTDLLIPTTTFARLGRGVLCGSSS
ncbi:hypothetical protein CEXT_498071 [Caerostris extrusa]|uniref:Uncharacterized protein n=1 Tax=Caerostris extrusa TaxID=172846 RepID=A0AAV4M2G3_CAEEX|nr:hypothetical protein CEXT_498071 [Caerostris extrusa]